MQNTLKAKLGRLHRLKEFGGEFGVSVAERELSDAETKVLREFYSGDPLAYDVARGIDSYRTRIEPIEEKYSSFWKRIWIPRKDETFNQEVMRVLGSMNNVGEGCAHPESFTTNGRRGTIWRLDKTTLALGDIMGLVSLGMVVYTMPESSGEVNAYINALANASPVIVLAMPYVMCKPNLNLSMKISLDNLRDAAQKTDEFLRQHYV